MKPRNITIHAPHLSLKPPAVPPPKRKPTPTTPTLAEMASNFTEAMTRWAAHGFTTVDEEEYKRREVICNACPFWEPQAMLGMGKCTKCGCTGKKRWLATERCPDRLW